LFDYIARFMNKHDRDLEGLTIFNNILDNISIYLTSNVQSNGHLSYNYSSYVVVITTF